MQIQRQVTITVFSPIAEVSTARTGGLYLTESEERSATVGSFVIVCSHKRRAVAEEAAEWFVRLEGARLSRPDRDRYLGWLKQSPLHVAEMLRLLRLGETLRCVLSAQRGPTTHLPVARRGWRWLH